MAKQFTMPQQPRWRRKMRDLINKLSEVQKTGPYRSDMIQGHDFDLLKKVVAQISKDASEGGYVFIDALLHTVPKEQLEAYIDTSRDE